MREILFKAKSISTGEWVYGNYAFTDTNGEQHFIFQNKAFEHEVDKDTICQFTGLTDKNGNKIWENDIIADKHYKYSVVWDEEEGSWMLETISRARYGLAGIGRINSEKFEVIGNVFDNKELLEE